jgi:hypothetical protein
VINLVLQWDSRDGFGAGLRGMLRSGMVDGVVYADDDLVLRRYEQEMPWFGRLDVSFYYGWDAGWGRLRFSVEVVNLLFFLGGEPIEIDCPSSQRVPDRPCPVERQTPVFLPSIGLRATI